MKKYKCKIYKQEESENRPVLSFRVEFRQYFVCEFCADCILQHMMENIS